MGAQDFERRQAEREAQRQTNLARYDPEREKARLALLEGHSILEHQLQDSGARVAVIDAAYVANVAAIAGRLTHLRTVAVAGGQAQDLSGLPFAGTVALSGWRQAEPWTGDMPRPQDVAAIAHARVVIVNPHASELDPVAHAVLRGTAAQLLPLLLAPESMLPQSVGGPSGA